MRRFKFLVMSLVLLTCLIGSQATISASSYSTGKAVIPTFYQGPITRSSFYVSNITDSPIEVIVTLYDSDGSIVIDDNDPAAGRIMGSSELLNYNELNTDCTLTFTLNSHGTGNFRISMYTEVKYGYGIIQWKQGGNVLQGLVVHGGIVGHHEIDDSTYAVPVNGGLPF
jgi:hypothetical protein